MIYVTEIFINLLILIPEAHSEPRQSSKMGHFVKIGNTSQTLTIFTKNFILDVCRGSGYASEF